MAGGRLMLLDTAAMYFRAFHALPETITAPDGMPVNAVRGLLDIIARLVTEFEPGQVVACWDAAWRPRWRVELVPSYKAHRIAEQRDSGDVEIVPDALTRQIPVIREVLGAIGVPIVAADDAEADDVIGTLAAAASVPVDVVTSDRDLFQVIDDTRDVRVINTARGMNRLEIVTDAVLRERYGIAAAQYADFATLRGDPSDGLPGVAGVGEKTAATLLSRFGDLDALLTAAAGRPEAPLTPALASKLRAADEDIRRAARIVRVTRDLDVAVPDAAELPLSTQRAEQLTERYALGGSMQRALAAFAS